jgi:hypothetical protein
MGFGASLHGTNFGPLMSGLGHFRTLKRIRRMSALPLKADINRAHWDVRLVPLTSDLRLDAPQQSLLRYSMRPAAAI